MWERKWLVLGFQFPAQSTIKEQKYPITAYKMKRLSLVASGPKFEIK